MLNLTSASHTKLFLLLLFATSCSFALQWLTIATLPLNSCKVLHPSQFTKRQRGMCINKGPQVMRSIRKGAILAIHECQHQLRNQRWNCSVIDRESLFGNALRKESRETAFVSALSSAGVTYAVTRDCRLNHGRSGSICGCDRSISGGHATFQSSGCSDNVIYGSFISRKFVDSKRRKDRKRDRFFMEMHNNEAGRRTITENMKKACKCQGVSGSCQMKTCWKSMEDFRVIGAILKKQYLNAVLSQVERQGNRVRVKPILPKNDMTLSSNLIYLEEGPTFCEKNLLEGSLGTFNRKCNSSAEAQESCNFLCCGRGYNTKTYLQKITCNCKFLWCCKVDCGKCDEYVSSSYCN